MLCPSFAFVNHFTRGKRNTHVSCFVFLTLINNNSVVEYIEEIVMSWVFLTLNNNTSVVELWINNDVMNFCMHWFLIDKNICNSNILIDLHYLDCIGSAFNVKGAMQCPNCRKIEKGQWLYANGSRSYPEFSMDEWTHDEDLYDLSYSEMVRVLLTFCLLIF